MKCIQWWAPPYEMYPKEAEELSKGEPVWAYTNPLGGWVKAKVGKDAGDWDKVDAGPIVPVVIDGLRGSGKRSSRIDQIERRDTSVDGRDRPT